MASRALLPRIIFGTLGLSWVAVILFLAGETWR